MSGQWWLRRRGVAEVVIIIIEIISTSVKIREGWQTNVAIKEGIMRSGIRRGGGSSSSSSSITSKTVLSNGKVMLKLHHLPLQQSYGTNASINRVPKPCFRLISKWIHRVLSLFLRNLNEDLAHIACPEHLVHLGEFLALVRAKVRCKYAIGYAPSLQELASCTRRAWTWLIITLHGSISFSISILSNFHFTIVFALISIWFSRDRYFAQSLFKGNHVSLPISSARSLDLHGPMLSFYCIYFICFW